ncbi:MAG: TonB-dependent receptor [Steroidobacteraceae bacterium]
MRLRIVPALILAALSGLPAQVVAQQSALEEVTVTATRRTERLQDVASSASVFSGEDLQALRVLQPLDLAEQTPGLLAKYGPNGLATVGFYVRGVGINDFTGTVDPSVGVYVDEVFQPTPDMLNFAVHDIARVEVLRGPQGTLYGRNSTGGAINFITARPTEEFEGFARAGYGSYDTFTAAGAVSGPLADTLRGRLSVSAINASSSDGYAFNRFTDNELGKIDSLAVRGQIEWLPSEDFSLRLIYNYGDSESELPLLQHVGTRDPANLANVCGPVIAGRVDEGACVDFLGYFDDDGDIYTGDANVDPELFLRSDDVTLTMNWNLGSVTLTSISGYADFSKRQSQDIDASPNVVADNFTFNDVENFSQEIRLTSDDSYRLPWIVGANYGSTDIDWFQTIDLTALAIPTSNGAVQSTESWALFGQLTIPLSDTWDVVGGLRFTNETRDWRGATFVGTFANLEEALASGAPRLSELPIPAGDPREGGPLDFPTSVDEEKVDFSAVLRYRPNDDAMYYLSVSEAFRSGGYSSAVIFSQEALEPYDSETLRSYEIGMKRSLAGNRVRFNASAFFYDFEDFQATFVRATEASARLQNAGDVEITGLEASLDWIPVDNLTIGAGLSLLDTEIVETDVVLPPLDGGPESTIEGNEIPNAPSVSFSGRARYQWPVSGTLAAAIQTDFTYVDEHFLEPNNREYLSEDGYFIANARLSLLSQDERWSVSAWVKNLGDEEYRTAAQDLALSLGFSEIVVGVPTTWGLEFEYRF